MLPGILLIGKNVLSYIPVMKFKGNKIAHISIGISFIISTYRIIKELPIIDIEQSKKASRIIFNNSKEST